MREWDTFARYYDLYFQDRTLDIDFWISQAKLFGSPVLELTCGTGRLTFPIANAGVQISGIDISHAMLSIAKKKLERENAKTRKNVAFIEADATSFAIPNRLFTAVFSPWGFVAVTNEEQDSLLDSVRLHLKPHGYFIIDVYNHQEQKHDWEHFGIQDYKYFPEKSLTIVRQVQTKAYAKTKINRMVFMWDFVKKNGQLKRIITERTERRYPRRDAEHLLISHGFSLKEIYGNYDKSAWSKSSPRIIIIAQKR